MVDPDHGMIGSRDFSVGRSEMTRSLRDAQPGEVNEPLHFKEQPGAKLSRSAWSFHGGDLMAHPKFHSLEEPMTRVEEIFGKIPLTVQEFCF